MSAAAVDSGSGDHHLAAAGGDSACSTPFVSAPSSPARNAPFPGGFFSAPASPARGCGGGGQGGAGEEYGCEFEFEFDFSSRFPSPAPAAMSSADELFHNGQIRPMRLASFLLRPQAATPPLGDVGGGGDPPREQQEAAGDERGGRLRSRSVHRRSRSHSPFRTWLSPSSPAPAARASVPEEPAAPSASRSSSSSSTASSASSSSSRSSRRWRFLKDLLHRSSSDGGNNPRPPPPTPTPPAPKTRDPSPAAAAARGRGGGRRRSAHERLYVARRAEVEEMRRRTFLPYQQGFLFGCLGLSSRGCGGAMRGLSTAAAAAAKSRS